jgi:hypothetical protein
VVEVPIVGDFFAVFFLATRAARFIFSVLVTLASCKFGVI